MNKISLIIQREYLTRVKKKSFIIMTFLSPVIFAAMMVVPGWLASQEDTKEKVIAINDTTGQYADALHSTDYIKYETLASSSAEKDKLELAKEYDALLVIDGDLLESKPMVQLYSDGQITMDVVDNIKNNLNSHLRQLKLESYNIEGLDVKIKELNNLKVKVKTTRLDEDGSEKKSSAEMAIFIGMAAAFLIYMIMIMYGTQVMRGVIEEKTNRIVEVMISSIKPFQLMMGKIIGIGLVALTQFFLWIALTFGFMIAIQTVVADADKKAEIVHTIEHAQTNAAVQQDNDGVAESINNVFNIIKDANMPFILSMFVFYFLGGYLIYSALFAAIGSAIDNETETQQFVMPVLLPLIFSIYVAMFVFRNPHGDLAFWFSMIPLTSPVVMMSRIPYDVATWELLLSMAILVASFLFFTWFAARVYRTGILMYGKKVSYKEIWKWFIQAGK